MKTGSLVFFILFSISGFSQSYMDTWISYLPYNNASKVAVTENRVYCATDGGLFYYNKSDNSLNKFSKEDGLSDSEISAIAYSEYNQSLIITYQDANIDIVQNNTIYNLSDIMRYSLLGDKSIYSVYIYEEFAYLSCGFGIVVLNLEKKEIKETYYLGGNDEQLKINDISIYNSIIYAATEDGLYYADLENQNLIDFNNWSEDSRFSGENNQVLSLSSGSSGIYVSVQFENSYDDSILYNTNGQWKTYPYYQSSSVPFLEVIDDKLLVCSDFHVDLFEADGTNSKHLYTGSPQMAELDDNNDLWIADALYGLFNYPDNGYAKVVIPEGPSDIEVFDLAYSDGRLLGVAGGATSSWNNIYRNARVYSYEDHSWTNWESDTIKDLVKIIIDPSDNQHYFAASWGYGLLEFQGSEMTNQYLTSNSSLMSVISGQDNIRLAGLDFDDSGNLWITNSGVSSPISVLSPEGDWYSFELSSQIDADNLGDIIITQNDHKWIILTGGEGLFAFSENSTLENDEGIEYKKFSIVDDNNDLITNEVYSVAEDREGNIWVGTDQGPVVYYSPYSVFEDDVFYAQQIIIPRNDGTGLGDLLLGTETITCIEVDGANRKWLGTEDGGVFLVSEDGLEQIHEFNTSNSPLLSNSIIDISIADETGEVFIATEKGIISYISDATEPDGTFEDVYVFPNPVREDYYGDIVVSGLVEDTYVKFTDLNGNLVYETSSLGGQAIWDGTNYNGERVATGVYLVFCTTSDGLQTFVTKLLFIH